MEEAEWIQSRVDQLNFVDEARLKAACHSQAYQQRITRSFNKRVRPRNLKEGDLVLQEVRPIDHTDPRGKFKPKWEGPYIIQKILPGMAVQLTDLDGIEHQGLTNADQLKKYYA